MYSGTIVVLSFYFNDVLVHCSRGCFVAFFMIFIMFNYCWNDVDDL